MAEAWLELVKLTELAEDTDDDVGEDRCSPVEFETGFGDLPNT